MILRTNSTKPLYIQISEWLETEILKGNFKEDEKIYSQYSLADMFTINPATAAKGLNVLAEENILYDKRGLGKFVAKGAIKIIRDKRKNEILTGLIEKISREALHLQIDHDELLTIVSDIYNEVKGDLE